jgi:hypothetical protein
MPRKNKPPMTEPQAARSFASATRELKERVENLHPAVKSAGDAMRELESIPDGHPIKQVGRQAAQAAKALRERQDHPTVQVDSPKLRKRGERHKPQGDRVDGVIKQVFPNGIPSRAELSDSEFCNKVAQEFTRPMEAGRLGVPSKATVLRMAGRRRR